MRNAFSHQGKNERQRNKSKHKRCYYEVSGLVLRTKGLKKSTKKCAARAN